MAHHRAAENRRTRAAWIPALALCALLTPPPNLGQTQNSNKGDEARTACSVELVAVEVQVKDVMGSSVVDLNHDRFVVYEEGEVQQIAILSVETESDVEPPAARFKISYYSTTPKRTDWEFRRIRVKVRRAKQLGLTVTYDPAGYFAPPVDWERNNSSTAHAASGR